MAINVVRVDRGVRTVVTGGFRTEKLAGVRAAEIALGDAGVPRDYDTLEIEDTVAGASRVVAVAPSPVRVIQVTSGQWMQVVGRLFATQQEAENDALIRSRHDQRAGAAGASLRAAGNARESAARDHPADRRESSPASADEGDA